MTPHEGRSDAGESGSRGVSLVIPGRNCARTVRDCLDAAVAIVQTTDTPLDEILFVDDGSTDGTASIVSSYPVKLLHGTGGGPGAARNIGWRAARHPWVWFIDSDCVAEPDALDRLLPHLEHPSVGGVGGSYGNMYPRAQLACLIHEEIIERHRAMPKEVNFLGGFNVLYRRSVLEEAGGFDEGRFNGPGSPGAEDADLSYRVAAAGHRLRFEPTSRVKHFHPTHLGRYLRSQRRHGYWRVFLHMRHRHQAKGDTYSGWLDHVQPFLAMLVLATLPLMYWPMLRWIAPVVAALLAAAQAPMTLRLVRRLGSARYLSFAGLGFVRAYWRGAGMVQGVFGYLLRRVPK